MSPNEEKLATTTPDGKDFADGASEEIVHKVSSESDEDTDDILDEEQYEEYDEGEDELNLSRRHVDLDNPTSGGCELNLSRGHHIKLDLGSAQDSDKDDEEEEEDLDEEEYDEGEDELNLSRRHVDLDNPTSGGCELNLSRGHHITLDKLNLSASGESA